MAGIVVREQAPDEAIRAMRRGASRWATPLRVVALTALLSTPAAADVAEAVADVITPAYAALADRAADLAETASRDCADTPALHAGFASVWDAWARIDFLRIGPVETDGRGLAMAFWPDPKSSGLRAQQALLDDGAALADDPDGFARLSVAARGLSGLERLIYPSALTGEPDATCRLIRATAADLARMTAAIAAEWPAYATTLTQPGGDNTLYLTETEARQALYTQLVTGLGALETMRLGRPLGTFDKPRPERAEAVASARSLANIVQSLTGMRDLALALDPDAARSRAAFDHALTLAAQLDDPALYGVTQPQGRLEIEIVQQAVVAARQAVEAEIGPALGVSAGFNAQDGD